MFFDSKIVVFVVFFSFIRIVSGDGPYFRVLAPEFVCPNDEESLIKPPDNTVVTIKTAASELEFTWTVRWSPLVRPSQRLTLLLWRTVRALEAKLNGPQPEPFVYVIDNVELLEGVEYIFNVTANEPGSENSTSQTFKIDNIKGDQKLMIEGRSDKFSLLLIGATEVYADMEYIIQAEVTTCTPTQDYYFQWRLESASSHPILPHNTTGSRLQLPPHSLQAGELYYVRCTVYRLDHEFVTQTVLPLQVLYRGLGLNLNLDELIVTVNNRFVIETIVMNTDYYGETPQFDWGCNYENKPCESFNSINSEILTFSNGLANLGHYELSVTASVFDQEASANLTVKVVEAILPSIQINPLPRLTNEHTIVTLVANASNVTPSCTLTWYFATQLYLTNYTDTCDDCQHGEALSDTVTVLSLEENFLNELTDFTNVTEWRQVTVQMPSAAGRARFVAQCGCSLTFSCETQGLVYGDIFFDLNQAPGVDEVKVSPDSGIAMETVFRLSTLAASDEDKPLLYSFYCSVGDNDTLLLGSNLDHLAVETFLPFVGDTGTSVWVEVCDSLGACSTSEHLNVVLDPGAGRTMDALVETMRGNVARCEMMMLVTLVKCSVTTYINTNQEEVLPKFINFLIETIPTSGRGHCTQDAQLYSELLQWLNGAGVDVSSLFE